MAKGKKLDGFLNFFRLNPDDDDYDDLDDDFYDLEEEDADLDDDIEDIEDIEEEEEPRRTRTRRDSSSRTGVKSTRKKASDDRTEQDSAGSSRSRSAAADSYNRSRSGSSDRYSRSRSGSSDRYRSGSRSNVVHMRSSYQSGGEIEVFKPTRFEDSEDISDAILQGKAVVINFNGFPQVEAQRITDFVGGTCYSIDGDIKTIDTNIIAVVPQEFRITGDVKELFNTFDDTAGTSTEDAGTDTDPFRK